MSRDINERDLAKNRHRHEVLRREYYDRAVREHIPDYAKQLPVVQDTELYERRAKIRQIRAYYAQAYIAMTDHTENLDAAYGLVDADGCLVRINGTREILSWLAGKNIRLGTKWTFDTSGCSAVTIGLDQMRCISTCGKENTLRLLQDTAIYFAPLRFDTIEHDKRLGGIVIFTEESKASSIYLSCASEMASSLMIRVSMAYRTSEAFNGIDSKGMVLLDINTRSGAVTMTHHNQALFKILELPPISYQEMYFKPFEEFVDPLPRNRRLWEVITGLEAVEDEEMTLRVRGRNIDCIVTTKPHMQENINTKGTLLYVTTRREISHEVSRHTNSGAILSNVNIVGKSNVIRSRIAKARLLANTDSNVMILGESGTGKDIFAQAIHNMSDRRDKPFIAVNCGALPRDLIESELFGYEGGAFTGARKQGNLGKFELADGGTLFLDEIGELPLDLQATLLRAVEQKSFMRLGSNKLVHADVKIISATNADIQKMIDEKKFRSDLYYRLGTMQLFLPPLRERGDDVILLAEHFAQRIAQRTHRQPPVFSEGAKAFIRQSPWKGNVRELQNVMECVVQLYSDNIITREEIEENVDQSYLADLRLKAAIAEYEKEHAAGAGFPFPDAGRPADREAGGRLPQPAEGADYSTAATAAMYGQLYETQDPNAGTPRFSASAPFKKPGRGNGHKMTREELMEALNECGGNRSEAAKLLGVGRKTLYRYMERFGVE